MDHSQLIAELPDVERMTPQERIAQAKDRRRAQLRLNGELERALPPPRPRRPRLRFSPEVALLEATGRADAAEVERLLNEGAEPNSHNEDGLTPLHQCAIDDNQQIMLLLLNHGADVNAKDTEQWTPLHAAACCAHIDVVNILISRGANLLAVNADGNMPYDICDDDATLDAIETEMATRGITQAYIDEQRGAPEKAMLDEMKAMHQQGMPLDQRQPDGSTFLHVAAAQGFYDVAAFLLRCGVSPLARDNDLWQPLHAAANWAQPDLVELICEYGGDINAKNNVGEMPSDLAEDPQTRATISTLQQQEARKKRIAFGVRDSRRQSRKRKKFESPQQVATGTDTSLSARGAIRRQSLRDRSGMTPARLEAQKEGAEILRSWSKEDVSQGDVSSIPPLQHNSPSKRVLKGGSNKAKPMSPDEWLKKLERGEEEDEDSPKRVGSQRRRPKKGGKGGPVEMQDLQPGGEAERREKTICCCTIC